MNILQKYRNSNDRSRKAINNIAISFGAKGISILCSLLIIPITIDYLNPTQYGIWLTISSVVGWIVYFDLGLGNGFRNKFAEAKADGDTELARSYVSTSYLTIAAIVGLVFIVAVIGNIFIDWAELLKVDGSYSRELSSVFLILCAFICLNMVASLFATLLTADQKPGQSALINCVGQVLSLAVIFILTKTTEGSLKTLAIYYSGIQFFVMAVVSILMFTAGPYREYAPDFKHFRKKLIGDIFGKGIQFFIICVSALVIFQMINLILSRELGPLSVTQYTVSYKYFSIIEMVLLIIITPYWSAFTEAYSTEDFKWMTDAMHRLEKVFFIALMAGVLMLAVSPWLFKIWIHDAVEIPFMLSVSLTIFTLVKSLGNMYMYMINGIGTIRLQLIIYVLFALIAWPGIVWSCRLFGVSGAVIIPTATFLVQAIICRIQLGKLLNRTAAGIWAK